MDRILPKDRLRDFLKCIVDNYQVIAPIRSDSDVIFAHASDEDEIVTDFTNSVVPPKEHLFSQMETLFEFQGDENEISIVKHQDDTSERVLFGVRPCDMKSFSLLDKVFGGEYADPSYLNKRKRTMILGMGCTEPQDSCFCTSFGYGPLESCGADVFISELSDRYFVQSLTSRGEKLLLQCRSMWTEPSEYDREELEEVKQRSVDMISLKVDADGVHEKLQEIFESDFWEKLSRKCLLCGICTYVCPTCHCFDMSDEVRANLGRRYRSWDSCMFADFTKMAGGHSPRPGKKQRIRQRFMHKLNYSMSRYGEYLCVGCGRCIAKCPVNMDIAQVITDVRGVETGE
jgi:sulfhydrogenase subunit beta (sulfur reductase)